MKVTKKIIMGLLLVFAAAQCFRPQKNEGAASYADAFVADTHPPKEVQVILRRACFDCHSDVTRYPWYAAITPVNYWLEHHIKHGKSHFNISHWSAYTTKEKDEKLKNLIDAFEHGWMPLESYTWIHKDAIPNDTEVKHVVGWAKHARLKYQEIPIPIATNYL